MIGTLNTTQGSLGNTPLSSFSTLLAYPRENYKDVAEECSAALDGAHREMFRTFLEFVRERSIDDLQVAYTDLFDLNFHISLYAGYHLFGESYLRSMFLVGLSSRFKSYGFEVQNELHDHISVLIKFIAVHPETELADELLEDAILPMLNRIIWSKTRPEDKPDNIDSAMAYYQLLHTLLAFLQGTDEVVEDKVVSLPVKEGTVENDIDQWIKGDKRLKEDS